MHSLDPYSLDELLALLYLCKTERTQGPVEGLPKDELLRGWARHREEFAPRLKYLSPDERRYLVMFSHLQSTEELDIDSETAMRPLLDRLGGLMRELAAQNGSA